MPVSKAVRRAARQGGNVPAGNAAAAPAPKKEAPQTAGLFILEVKGTKLKESAKGPYRSITGAAADGTLFWAPVDASHKPAKGQMITLRGENKGPFGDGKFHKILGPNYFPDVVSISDKPRQDFGQAEQEELKFDGEGAEALHQLLETAVKQHGIGKILTVLGELT